MGTGFGLSSGYSLAVVDGPLHHGLCEITWEDESEQAKGSRVAGRILRAPQ
jgi:hypothetical protein